MDHKTFLQSLPAETRAALLEKEDAPGLRLLALHAGLIVGLGVLIAVGIPGWWLLIPIQGIVIAFTFTLQHECTHQTPFKTLWINEAVGHGVAILLAQPFLWFRYFHLAHHRYTNDPEHDPELDGDGKPETWRDYWVHLSTIRYWQAKARVLWANAFGQIDAPYLPSSTHARLRREARLILLSYAAVILFALLVHPVLFWVWILPLIFGFPFLRLYLLAEHGHCPPVANMFDNTRTTMTNRIVRLLAWNMPYHSEHHTLPAVPFHKLPEFHRHIRGHLSRISQGYIDFTRQFAGGLRE